MFFLLYGFTYDGVFDDFPNISGHFPKIFQICSEGQTKVLEDFRRLPKIFEENPKIFRSYINEFKYNFDKLDVSEIFDIFTSEDTENTPLKFRM